jgi:hypothetical protein
MRAIARKSDSVPDVSFDYRHDNAGSAAWAAIVATLAADPALIAESGNDPTSRTSFP